MKLYNSGDFRSSIADMEHALSGYYKAYENCLAGCEGSYEPLEFKDFYPTIAGKRTEAGAAIAGKDSDGAIAHVATLIALGSPLSS